MTDPGPPMEPRRQLLRWRVAAILIATALARTAAPITAQAGGTAASPEATAYLDAALAIVQANFLHRDAIDWPTLRREALYQAGHAQTSVDTYPVLRYVLAKLGDHHSYLQLTPALAEAESARKPTLVEPSSMPAPLARTPTFPFPSPFRTRRIPEGALVIGSPKPVAQIVVPLFASPNRPELDSFATAIQAVIRTLQVDRPCGWVVDLRGNGGGNIWAMLAGIGPLIGDPPFGARIDHVGVKTDWFYRDGAAGERTGTLEEAYAASSAPPVVVPGTPPVAVLIDRDTGSSGEGVALAFHKRPATRFFGETTFGAATSTFPFPLSDGAQIYLVTAIMVDREGHEYPTGITPDEVILSETTISTTDPVLRAAGHWVSAQAGCHR
jgi:carboxyl-terminal processing protease